MGEGRPEGAPLLSPEGHADASEHRGELALDVPGLDAKDADAVPAEVVIPQAVMHLAPRVCGPVDLDGEPRLRGKEVDDGGAEDDLPAELDAEPACPEGLPKDALRRRRVPTRVASTRGEESALVTKRRKEKTHGASVPARAPASCPTGADAVTAAKIRAIRIARPLARRVRHGTRPAPSLVRRQAGSSSSAVTCPTAGRRAVVLGVAMQVLVSSVLVPGVAAAKGGHDCRDHTSGPQVTEVTEPTEPSRGLCASPCSLAGIA